MWTHCLAWDNFLWCRQRRLNRDYSVIEATESLDDYPEALLIVIFLLICLSLQLPDWSVGLGSGGRGGCCRAPVFVFSEYCFDYFGTLPGLAVLAPASVLWWICEEGDSWNCPYTRNVNFPQIFLLLHLVDLFSGWLVQSFARLLRRPVNGVLAQSFGRRERRMEGGNREGRCWTWWGRWTSAAWQVDGTKRVHSTRGAYLSEDGGDSGRCTTTQMSPCIRSS